MILDFYVIENLVQSLHLNYLNNCMIPDTYFSHIEDVRFAKNCPIKTKEEAYNGCRIHHLWQCSDRYGAYYREVLRFWLYSKLFISFLLAADYPPCGLSGRNYGKASGLMQLFRLLLTCCKFPIFFMIFGIKKQLKCTRSMKQCQTLLQ